MTEQNKLHSELKPIDEIIDSLTQIRKIIVEGCPVPPSIQNLLRAHVITLRCAVFVCNSAIEKNIREERKND